MKDAVRVHVIEEPLQWRVEIFMGEAIVQWKTFGDGDAAFDWARDETKALIVGERRASAVRLADPSGEK